MYTGKENGPHKAFTQEENLPENPCELVLDQLIKNGSGMSVVSSIFKLANKGMIYPPRNKYRL